MSSASSAVTYTYVYTDSEPARVFWGADEELSDEGSSRVIVYGYDGFPMLPVAPPSPDYIPGPEEPQTPPAPQDEDEHELMFIQPHDPDFVPEPIYPEYIPLEDEHILPSDPEEDPEEYEADETGDGPVDYPLDGGDDGDDDDADSSGYDADDEGEDEEDEEEEEHLAPADSALVIPIDELVSPPEGTKPTIPSPSTDTTTIGARISIRPQTSISLPPEAEPPRKRLCLSTLGSRMTLQETVWIVEEEAYAAREAWAQSAGLSQIVHHELQTLREQLEKTREEIRNMALTSTVVQGGVTVRKQGDNQRGINNMQYSRVTKIKFLKFGGKDVKGWLFKCEQFFKVDEIADDQKMFSLEVIVGNDNEEIVWDAEKEDVDCELSEALNVVHEEDNVLYISLNAVIRRNLFQTLRVIGYGEDFVTDMMILPLGALQWLHGKQTEKNLGSQSQLSSMILCVYPESVLNMVYATSPTIVPKVAIDPNKIQVMKDCLLPRTLKQLKGILDLTGNYGRFIKNYAMISHPLTKLLRKNEFVWNKEAEQSFEQLKQAMMAAPILKLPNFEEDFAMETDALKEGIGGSIATTSLLTRKGKLVIGNDSGLQHDLIEYFHVGTMDGNSGVKMAAVTQNTKNTTIMSILQHKKLTRPNFKIWFQNLRIVLRSEEKLAHLEQLMTPLSYPAVYQVERDSYKALNDAQNEIACLMLGSMSPELWRTLENYKAYDMIQELKTTFEEQAKQKLFETVKVFHTCKQEDGQSVSSYLLKMKSYMDTLECLGYAMPNKLGVSLILNSLNKDYDQFVQNYNMHSMGKMLAELHDMLKLYEKGILKKAETPAVLVIRKGKIQKDKKKPQGTKGKAKGKHKLAYASKTKIPPSPKRDNLKKDSICHHCKVVGHWGGINEFENLLDKKIKAIRSDRGGEYLSHEFVNHMKSYGIGYALETTACMLNMVLTKKVNRTPYEIWHEKAPNLSYLRVWGCEALVKRDMPVKLDSRSIKCIFVVSGSDKGLKIIQEEDTQPSKNTSKEHDEDAPIEVEPQNVAVLIRRSTRIRQAPDIYGYYVDVKEYELGDFDEPPNYIAALADPKSDKWLEAMNTKMQSMKDNQADMDGNVHTFKAHLVAKGYTQTHRVDYKKTFSPVADIRAIRTLLAIVAFYDYGYTPMMEKPDYRKSQGAKTPTETGYVFVLNGGAVDWKSAKQSAIAMSSTEAEYIAADEASMKAVWMRKFIDGLGGVVPSNKRPIEMLYDNEPA
nr:zinc finger, CCHC-type [Tanacetum cinerariifolium]